ncbi:MAG: DinB family protein [Ardenticatenales bacterium]|nr:DinB family protein [Ardenticatenales bacterium]
MDAITLLKSAFDNAHNWFAGTVADVTAEQANALPAGRAHPIASQMAHVAHSEDAMIGTLTGQPPLWEREGYGERLGLPMLFSQTSESSRAYQVAPADLADYTKAVFAQTDAYVSSLTPEDLDRPIDFTSWGLGHMPLGNVLTGMLLGNTFAHTGEISALKGTQGLQGYPF